MGVPSRISLSLFPIQQNASASLMAVTFTDLHTESGLTSLESYISRKTFISEDAISKDDVKVFGAVTQKPGDGFSNASRWYETVYLALAARFPGQAVGVKFSGQSAQAAPTVEPLKEGESAADDDLDLFGDETEDDKKAAAEREADVKASSKKKESGKSSVLLDVKPWMMRQT